MQYGNSGDHPIIGPAQDVVNEAELVQIAPRSLVYMAAELAAEADIVASHWLAAAPESIKHFLAALPWPERVAFFTVYHAVGFSYWGEPRWQIVDTGNASENGGTYDGAIAWLLCLAKSPQLLQGDFLSNLDATSWEKISQGVDGVPMPMSAERLEILNHLGAKLDQFKSLISEKATTGGGMGALDLAFYIGQNLPGFEDLARYNGLKIPFLKRAQLLTNDLNQLFIEYRKPLLHLDNLTAFADYKLPQLLREKGILLYDDMLAHQIDKKIEMAPGCQAEVELRACTIIAVDKLRIELLRAHLEWDARTVDAKLWLAGQKLDRAKSRPYHRCRTIYY